MATVSHRSNRASVLDATTTDAAQADARTATANAARIVADAAVAAHATALGNAIVNKMTAIAGDAIVTMTFTLEQARVRTLAMVRAYQAGADPVFAVGELDGLAAALEAAAPPPPVHDDACNTLAWAATQATMRATWPGITDDLIEAVSGRIPKDCNCKASKPKRASTATGARGTPTRIVPVGTAAVTYNGVGMPCAQAATRAATDYPTATSCAAYVKAHALGRSLNARIPLRADVTAGRIPAGVIVFAGDTEATTPTA